MAAAGPDTGRIEPTAGPHSGATDSGANATPPPVGDTQKEIMVRELLHNNITSLVQIPF